MHGETVKKEIASLKFHVLLDTIHLISLPYSVAVVWPPTQNLKRLAVIYMWEILSWLPMT